MKKLQEIFVMHFARDDVKGAHAFLAKWQDEWHQRIPDHDYNPGHGIQNLDNIPPGYTRRAMCGHISDYLEGFTGREPESYNCNGKGGRNYMDTKHGNALYHCEVPE